MGITFIGILTGVYSGDTISQYFKDWLSLFPNFAPYAGLIANTVVVIIITYFTIVLGELLPKKLGMLFPDRIIQKVSGFMTFFSKLFSPFTWLLTKTVHVYFKFLNLKNFEEIKLPKKKFLLQLNKEPRGRNSRGGTRYVERVF